MILDIGCGENPWFKGREDVINLDIRPIRGVVHIIADAKKLLLKIMHLIMFFLLI
jgi:hypothetical protein